MVKDWSLLKEISLSETGDRGSECDDCHIRSHVFCIRSHESLFRSHERQIRSGRIVCNPLAEWALCFFSSEVSQLLSSESEVISASSSAIPHWAVKATVLFLHLWSYVCCLFKFRKLCPSRPEGAEALSPGQRPGLLRVKAYRPVRAKALKLQANYNAFALTGRLVDCQYTQGDALG